MALSIIKTINEAGVTASYWRYADGGESLSPSIAAGIRWMVFVGYIDAAMRAAGKQPVPGASIRVQVAWSAAQAAVTAAGGDVVAAAYALAKAAPEFTGAEDI